MINRVSARVKPVNQGPTLKVSYYCSQFSTVVLLPSLTLGEVGLCSFPSILLKFRGLCQLLSLLCVWSIIL